MAHYDAKSLRPVFCQSLPFTEHVLTTAGDGWRASAVRRNYHVVLNRDSCTLRHASKGEPGNTGDISTELLFLKRFSHD